ncbi:hypothetical protein GCM10017673_09770 [Streptosporangium violaceochromogenes]|nr:hypothetical protein GCM10017673_09770 [Streptosporangium violaceochromogenes]
MNRKLKSILAATFVGGAILAVPTPSLASTDQQVRDCLEYFPSPGRVYVEYRDNYCGGNPVRSKVVIDWGPDSKCITLNKLGDGYTFTYSLGSLNYVAGC